MSDFIFDIVHYVKLNNYSEKRKYIDEYVFFKARQISNEYFVSECEFIIIQIREYCLLFPVINDVLVETPEKLLSNEDAQIHDYVLREKNYTKELIKLKANSEPVEFNINIDNFIDSFENILGITLIDSEYIKENRESNLYGIEKYYNQFSNEFAKKYGASELWYIDVLQKEVKKRIDKLVIESNIKYSVTWEMVEENKIDAKVYFENSEKINRLLMLNEFNEFLNKKKQLYQTSTKKQAPEIINTFESSLTFTDEKKTILHTELIKLKFIASNTDLEAFKLIFSGEPIKYIKEPVNWILKGLNKHTNKKALIDFIRVLVEYKFLSETELSTNKKQGRCLFEKLEKCFRDENNNLLTFYLSNAKDFSKHYKTIDNIINSL